MKYQITCILKGSRASMRLSSCPLVHEVGKFSRGQKGQVQLPPTTSSIRVADALLRAAGRFRHQHLNTQNRWSRLVVLHTCTLHVRTWMLGGSRIKGATVLDSVLKPPRIFYDQIRNTLTWEFHCIRSGAHRPRSTEQRSMISTKDHRTSMTLKTSMLRKSKHSAAAKNSKTLHSKPMAI